jgi:hypothetical protein
MTHPEPPSSDLLREQRLQRNLKIVVAGLGAFILLGLGAVAVKVVGLSTGNSPKVSSTYGTASSPETSVRFDLPRGAKIVSISLSANRLAVHHDGPAGPGISIFDAETGRRVLDLKPAEAVPHN